MAVRTRLSGRAISVSASRTAKSRSNLLHRFQSAAKSRIATPIARSRSGLSSGHCRIVNARLGTRLLQASCPSPSLARALRRKNGRSEELKFREVAMPVYVMLANWTDQGARQVKDSPKRLEAAKKMLTDMGGEFRSLYMTMGDYDLVVIYEAPDDAVAARFTLLLGQQGAARTRTMKAFPEAAYREIINSLA